MLARPQLTLERERNVRVVISLTFGILLAYVAGSVLGTQVVLSNVASMGPGCHVGHATVELPE